jgi:flavin-dependent dehydrogenase
MSNDLAIIGGGVAGLSAAIRLTELGIMPTLIEAGSYPSHKLCGEFFSPSCMPTLHRWGIRPITIEEAYFCTTKKTLKFRFPQSAGSLSHFQFDTFLADKAKANGARVITGTSVEKLDPLRKEITLSSGETLRPKKVIIATGRIPSHSGSRPQILYKGFKAHFEGFPTKDSLHMFAFRDAYLGVSPIENGKFNVACLISLKRANQHESIDCLLEEFKKENSSFEDFFKNGRKIFPEWMSASIPAYGLKNTPSWENCYFIGDAAGTIPPATGNGLAMAISGGILAAEYAREGDHSGFKRAWQQRHRLQIHVGKMLHHIMMKPWLGGSVTSLSKVMPQLPKAFFCLTR